METRDKGPSALVVVWQFNEATYTGLQTLGRSTRLHSSKPSVLWEGQGPAGCACVSWEENTFLCKWPQTFLKQQIHGLCPIHRAVCAHVCVTQAADWEQMLWDSELHGFSSFVTFSLSLTYYHWPKSQSLFLWGKHICIHTRALTFGLLGIEKIDI